MNRLHLILIAGLLVAISSPVLGAMSQDAGKSDSRDEIAARLKALSKMYKRSTDPDERARLAKKIEALKDQWRRLASEKNTEPEEDPRVQIHAELARIYREFKTAKTFAERTRLQKDAELLMGELRRLKLEEEADKEKNDVEALRREYAELMKKISNPNLPKDERKRLKGEAEVLQKRIKALQREEGEKPKKKPK